MISDDDFLWFVDDALGAMVALGRGLLPGSDDYLPPGRRQGVALFHVYEELAQHRGQMEVTRDAIVAAAR